MIKSELIKHYFCDRCGEEYEKGLPDIRFNDVSITFSNGLSRVCWPIQNKNICRKCANAFLEWWNYDQKHNAE